MMYINASHPTNHSIEFSYFSYIEEKIRRQNKRKAPADIKNNSDNAIDVQEMDPITTERVQREWEKHYSTKHRARPVCADSVEHSQMTF